MNKILDTLRRARHAAWHPKGRTIDAVPFPQSAAQRLMAVHRRADDSADCAVRLERVKLGADIEFCEPVPAEVARMMEWVYPACDGEAEYAEAA